MRIISSGRESFVYRYEREERRKELSVLGSLFRALLVWFWVFSCFACLITAGIYGRGFALLALSDMVIGSVVFARLGEDWFFGG